MAIGMLLISCASTSQTSSLKLTPDESEYLGRVDNMPTEFRLAKVEAEDAWGRALSWIGKYSSMKIQNATDYTIATYNPDGNVFNVQYGYSITKAPMGDSVEISVVCTFDPPALVIKSDAKRNAQILGLYMKSGEVMWKFIKR